MITTNCQPFLATVDNNDTVSYGCIRVALALQPSEIKTQPFRRNATLIKRVREIGIVNLILFGSKQTPHPVSLRNNPALYKKHSFLHSKEVYQV